MFYIISFHVCKWRTFKRFGSDGIACAPELLFWIKREIREFEIMSQCVVINFECFVLF
jgi:hypothetical protein